MYFKLFTKLENKSNGMINELFWQKIVSPAVVFLGKTCYCALTWKCYILVRFKEEIAISQNQVPRKCVKAQLFFSDTRMVWKTIKIKFKFGERLNWSVTICSKQTFSKEHILANFLFPPQVYPPPLFVLHSRKQPRKGVCDSRRQNGDSDAG